MKPIIFSLSILLFSYCNEKSKDNNITNQTKTELEKSLLIIDSMEIPTNQGTIYLKTTAFNSEAIYDLLINFKKNEWLINGEPDYNLRNESLEEKACFWNGTNPLRYSEELFPIETIISNLNLDRDEKYKIIEKIFEYKIKDKDKHKITNSNQLKSYSDSIVNEYLSWVKNRDGTKYTKGRSPEVKKIIDYYCEILDKNPKSIIIFSIGSVIHIYQLHYFENGNFRINKFNFHAHYSAIR